MSKRHLKGQSATEYLMTYGWAILAIVIVAGVLWNMGIFGGAGCQESLRGFAGSKVYVDTVVVHNISTNWYADIHAKNAAGTPIKIWNASGQPACWRDDTGLVCDGNLPANSERTFLNVANVTEQIPNGAKPQDCYSGVDIVIKYEVNGLNLTSSGKASGTLQG